MELSPVFYVVVVAAVIMVLYVWRVLNWLWFEPKKIEKFLKDQGLEGTPYKFVFGDLKGMAQMTTEAKSKPMSLTNHDIAPRVFPFFYKAVTTHGKNCFTWMGTKPMIHTSDPTIIQEVLANYCQFQKPREGNPLTKLLARGLLYSEADQWDAFV